MVIPKAASSSLSPLCLTTNPLTSIKYDVMLAAQKKALIRRAQTCLNKIKCLFSQRTLAMFAKIFSFFLLVLHAPMAQMLGLGFDCLVEKPFYRRKTTLIIEGLEPRSLQIT